MSTKTVITDKAKNIYNALRKAPIIKIASDNALVTSMDVADFVGDADNEVFFMEWEVPWSETPLSAKITEEGLEEAFIDKAYPDQLILIDSEGDEIAICIFQKASVTKLVRDYER